MLLCGCVLVGVPVLFWFGVNCWLFVFSLLHVASAVVVDVVGIGCVWCVLCVVFCRS